MGVSPKLNALQPFAETSSFHCFVPFSFSLGGSFFLSLQELQMLKFDSRLWVDFSVHVAFLVAVCPFSTEGI